MQSISDSYKHMYVSAKVVHGDFIFHKS